MPVGEKFHSLACNHQPSTQHRHQAPLPRRARSGFNHIQKTTLIHHPNRSSQLHPQPSIQPNLRKQISHRRLPSQKSLLHHTYITSLLLPINILHNSLKSPLLPRPPDQQRLGCVERPCCTADADTEDEEFLDTHTSISQGVRVGMGTTHFKAWQLRRPTSTPRQRRLIFDGRDVAAEMYMYRHLSSTTFLPHLSQQTSDPSIVKLDLPRRVFPGRTRDIELHPLNAQNLLGQRR